MFPKKFEPGMLTCIPNIKKHVKIPRVIRECQGNIPEILPCLLVIKACEITMPAHATFSLTPRRLFLPLQPTQKFQYLLAPTLKPAIPGQKGHSCSTNYRYRSSLRAKSSESTSRGGLEIAIYTFNLESR
jgi:hypothetical protein